MVRRGAGASQVGRLQQFFCLPNQIGRGFPLWQAGLEEHPGDGPPPGRKL